MSFTVSDSDSRFRDAVESCDLPIAAFNHRAHIRLAYIYLAENELDKATACMRDALTRLIEHHGVDPAKYHETLTTAWLLAVRHFMNGSAEAHSADDFIDRNPTLLDTHIMLTHYSPERLFSDPARKAFVPPDREVIPR